MPQSLACILYSQHTSTGTGHISSIIIMDGCVVFTARKLSYYNYFIPVFWYTYVRFLLYLLIFISF